MGGEAANLAQDSSLVKSSRQNRTFWNPFASFPILHNHGLRLRACTWNKGTPQKAHMLPPFFSFPCSLFAAFESFESAISHNPSDADIYYHRGQVLFITAQFNDAAENYKQSTNLDPDFIFRYDDPPRLEPLLIAILATSNARSQNTKQATSPNP